MPAPPGGATEHLCVLHFTLFIEQECAEIRRAMAIGGVPHEKQVEYMQKISDRGSCIVIVATGGFPMSDGL